MRIVGFISPPVFFHVMTSDPFPRRPSFLEEGSVEQSGGGISKSLSGLAGSGVRTTLPYFCLNARS